MGDPSWEGAKADIVISAAPIFRQSSSPPATLRADLRHGAGRETGERGRGGDRGKGCWCSECSGRQCYKPLQNM